MRETSSDVTIVGGGPCGSFAALNLAKLGLSVNVFEEHSEIGVPCHCAGHLSIKGLKLLGLHPLPPRILENTFYGAIFNSAKGKRFRVRFPSPVTCSVNRFLFDKYLAVVAKKNGVRYFLNSKVESLTNERDYVKGVIVRQGKTRERFLSKVTVDAEGMSSRILRQSGLSAFDSRMLVKTVQAEAENVKDTEADMVEVFLDKTYAPGFYAWLMPKRDGKAKVGLAAKKGNPKELLQRFMAKHPTASKKLGEAKITRISSHSITLGGPVPRTYSSGFLVVGDAASQVKPTTGGGVISGMTCAKIAADVVWEASHERNFTSDFLQLYQTRCNRIFGVEFKFMLRIRKMLDLVPDEKLDEAITFYSRIGLDKALQNFSDLDFQARSFLRTLQNPRMPIALSHFLLSYLLANR